MTETNSTDRLNPGREPGLVRKAASFTAAAVRHIADGASHVPEAVYENRLVVCRGCDRFDAESLVCLECGCRLAIKARWRSEECPLGRWPSPPLG